MKLSLSVFCALAGVVDLASSFAVLTSTPISQQIRSTASALAPRISSGIAPAQHSSGLLSFFSNSQQTSRTELRAGAKNDMSMAMERTYIMIKPDGVQRGIISDIVKRFEQRGFKLVAMKLAKPSRDLLSEHYDSLADKPFFPKLMDYMTSGPVVCMVWEGLNVVKTGRLMLGATNPLESNPGTIRGDFCIEVGRNICHGSDSVESAVREIGLWFKSEEIIEWDSMAQDWLYE